MCRKKLPMFRFVALVFLLGFPFAAGYSKVFQKGNNTQWDSYLPPGKGQELLQTLCTTCHDLGRVVKVRKDTSQWRKTVEGMLTALDPHYAEYLGDDSAEMIRYLADYMGPLSPTYDDLQNDPELKEKYLKGEMKSIIHINTAAVEELIRLPGISKDLAQEIVKYRQEKGPFRVAEDLEKVGRINEEQFKKIREFITVE